MKPLQKPDATDATDISTYVWDRFVRVFHWGLVIGMTVALVTGFVMGAMWITLHVVAGLTLGALVVSRIIWGFTGSHYARFKEFFHSPSFVLSHFKNLKQNTAPRYIGHNPLGGIMVFTLLFLILGSVITGVLVFGGVLKAGPFAGLTYALGDFLQELHEIGAIGLLILIVAHVGGVVYESLHNNENLAKSMVNGVKERRGNDAPSGLSQATRARPVIALGLASAVFIPLVLFGIKDQSGSIHNPPVSVSDYQNDFATECSDCHKAYHPSLLPAASWTILMTGLEDHFGEDASLDPQTVADISTWLKTVSADQTDTKAANIFRKVSSANPIAITKIEFWRETHIEIADSVFKRAPIYSRANCFACHTDAEQGWFYPANISVPPEPSKDPS